MSRWAPRASALSWLDAPFRGARDRLTCGGPDGRDKGEAVKRLAAVAATVVVAGVLGSPAAALARPQKAVCGPAAVGTVRCHAHVITDRHGNPFATSAPTGYGPADLRGAYNLTGTGTSTQQTIAIVDA